VKHISMRVAVMHLSNVVETADKRTLYANPLRPYTQALIAAVPVVHPAGRSWGRKTRETLAGDIPSAISAVQDRTGLEAAHEASE
jgi:oligopeptide/dipeptide ABC transporter ATP-binding protein